MSCNSERKPPPERRFFVVKDEYTAALQCQLSVNKGEILEILDKHKTNAVIRELINANQTPSKWLFCVGKGKEGLVNENNIDEYLEDECIREYLLKRAAEEFVEQIKENKDTEEIVAEFHQLIGNQKELIDFFAMHLVSNLAYHCPEELVDRTLEMSLSWFQNLESCEDRDEFHGYIRDFKGIRNVVRILTSTIELGLTMDWTATLNEAQQSIVEDLAFRIDNAAPSCHYIDDIFMDAISAEVGKLISPNRRNVYTFFQQIAQHSTVYGMFSGIKNVPFDEFVKGVEIALCSNVTSTTQYSANGINASKMTIQTKYVPDLLQHFVVRKFPRNDEKAIREKNSCLMEKEELQKVLGSILENTSDERIDKDHKLTFSRKFVRVKEDRKAQYEFELSVRKFEVIELKNWIFNLSETAAFKDCEEASKPSDWEFFVNENGIEGFIRKENIEPIDEISARKIHLERTLIQLIKRLHKTSGLIGLLVDDLVATIGSIFEVEHFALQLEHFHLRSVDENTKIKVCAVLANCSDIFRESRKCVDLLMNRNPLHLINIVEDLAYKHFCPNFVVRAMILTIKKLDSNHLERTVQFQNFIRRYQNDVETFEIAKVSIKEYEQIKCFNTKGKEIIKQKIPLENEFILHKVVHSACVSLSCLHENKEKLRKLRMFCNVIRFTFSPAHNIFSSCEEFNDALVKDATETKKIPQSLQDKQPATSKNAIESRAPPAPIMRELIGRMSMRSQEIFALRMPDVRQYRWAELLIKDRLGVPGGQGTARIVFTPDSSLKKVVKYLNKEDVENLREMLQEFVKLLACAHEHIVQIYGIAFETDIPKGIIMEYMDCGALHYTIHNRKQENRDEFKEKYGEREILEWSLHAASALQYLHSKRIIHRDVKPMNLLISQMDGRKVLKLADFGLAKRSQPGIPNSKYSTWCYAAPETQRSSAYTGPNSLREPCTVAIDVYSFGITLWEMTLRREPWDERNLKWLKGKDLEKLKF